MNSTLKGIILVALGASSYGMLASFVKMAYKQGFTTAEVTFSQFFLAILCLLVVNLFIKNTKKATKSDVKKLLISGSSMGFTSVLYYLCVKYLHASIAVVLLMQSVWIGVLIEAFIAKKMPTFSKFAAVVFVLLGTVLATNLLNNEIIYDFKGFLFGFLAAISFSITLYSTNSIAKELNAYKRSLFMLLGGGIIVLLFSLLSQILPSYLNMQLIASDFIALKTFDISILYTWGILLSVFGTVLPPILLNKGFPLTGVGLGSIVSAVELPVSVTFAFIFLQEQVLFSQWIGIAIILAAVLLINWNLIRTK
ncbi:MULTISPECIES: EamA family transporter [unclassified Flavobacterium]|uniref:EamA family transporter n=1 Tax=unclassified Flavobacterium TaxID=196869 RepID=UPI002224AC6B|nr:MULTISPECIES: EamA family transporter [unclassified Flavobacterium]